MTSSHSNGERETLYVTDAELIRRTGIPEKVARRLIRELDRLPSGFPPKDRLCGNRRYWPAVRDFFERRTATLAPSQTRRTGNAAA
jgi:hypothetical protein